MTNRIEDWDEWDRLETLRDDELVKLFAVVFDKVTIDGGHVYQHCLNRLFFHLFYRLMTR